MVGLGRPRSAIARTAAGPTVATKTGTNDRTWTRTSKCQPIMSVASNSQVIRGVSEQRMTTGRSAQDASTTSNRGTLAAAKILCWYRLPTTGGWVPSARAGHTAVTIGTDMIVFGGIVNGERVNELASFDLDARVWRRLVPGKPSVDAKVKLFPSPIIAATAPAPRAFHVAWVFGDDVYIHGGEGPTGGARASAGDPDLDGILGSVGRDPFAEEDGGAPLHPKRIVMVTAAGNGAVVPGLSEPKTEAALNGAIAGQVGWKKGKAPPLQPVSRDPERRSSVSVLEDLWRLNSRTLCWERLSSRLAPLGRKGHTASVVPLRGQPCVLVFGGAPAGRRGLSNALYSIDVGLLSVGQGTWERHQPSGSAPAPRQGHSLTAVGGGKRMVLFGGMAENGDLLGDIQERMKG